MKKPATIGKWLYAIAIAVFGIQHFLYADFVATLVPAWIPWHLFITYLVGVAFLAAALSIIIDKYVALSCTLLGLMLALFILLIHLQNLFNHPLDPQTWTRALQDVVIMGTALILTGDLRLHQVGKYLFTVPMLILGPQHFSHQAFVTAKVPPYFPAANVWDYLVGIVLIVAALAILSNRYMGMPALMLGMFLLLFALIYHVPLLIANINNGQLWTAAMLDIAIAGGAFAVSAIRYNTYKAVKLAA